MNIRYSCKRQNRNQGNFNLTVCVRDTKWNIMLTFIKAAYILCILVTILLWLVATEKGPCAK